MSPSMAKRISNEIVRRFASRFFPNSQFHSPTLRPAGSSPKWNTTKPSPHSKKSSATTLRKKSLTLRSSGSPTSPAKPRLPKIFRGNSKSALSKAEGTLGLPTDCCRTLSRRHPAHSRAGCCFFIDENYQFLIHWFVSVEGLAPATDQRSKKLDPLLVALEPVLYS
jgi:hypothetical protein